jgi:CRISPR-associated protein Cas2
MNRRGCARADSRTRLIVTYDICNPKRLRKVHKVMKGFGEALQYSVFCCDLTATSRVRCESALRQVINHNEDQVLFIDIGPAAGRGRLAVSSLGQAYTAPELRAIVS